MPQLTNEEFFKLIRSIESELVPLSISLNSEKEAIALKECDDYFNNKISNINDISPLAVYYIISKLDSKKQIEFLRKNIDYIKKHDNEIFMYTLMSPNSLSYYFSFEVIKELKKIDRDICIKVITSNQENLFNGFKPEEYLEFYKEFYEEINQMSNWDFVNSIYYNNRCFYNNIGENDINLIFEKQRKYNKEFMNFLLVNYKDKISNLKNRELLYFIKHIEDIDVFKQVVLDNFSKIQNALKNITEYDLEEYFSEIDSDKQEILISNYFDYIINKNNLKKIVYRISPKILIDIYKKDIELFKDLTLNDWIKLSSKNRVFNEEIKNILDTFNIDNIEELFDTDFYYSIYLKESVTALRYIELKYRSNIITDGNITDIDINTSIFSEVYFKNLSELKELFKNNLITRTNDIYKKHLTNFILYLKNKNIIIDIDNSFNEVEKLFYKIVMGKSISIVYEIDNITEITLINRIGSLEFNTDEFTINQLENYNVKHHKQLCSNFDKSDWHIKEYKKLILKLLLMIGFNNSKTLLEIDDSLPVIEHLVGNVDVKNIKLDQYGNPILNKKIINLLFRDISKIKDMLENKDNDLYKYFPRIFNEWEMIKLNEKDKSLKLILDYLKSDDVSVPPKYFRLEGLFKDIGCGNSIVSETLLLHDEMLKRVDSTIPKVSGFKDNYTYEMLSLDDFSLLSVGNKTDCCFTVLGNGYSCLKHACTSKNGRVFVVKKDGEIIAHSWVFRNGDLLCFDNIEISKKINCVDFFDLYLEAIDEIINTSYTCEGINDCIKNVTVGFTNFDKEIKGIENYPCLILKTCDLKDKAFGSRLGFNRKFVDKLPTPIEDVSYTDSKNVQYLIRGTDKFKLGQSSYLYQDERKEILHYIDSEDYSDEYINNILKRVNALMYVRLELENKLDEFKNIDIYKIREIYCNDDWFYIEYLDGRIDTFNYSFDERSKKEYDLLFEQNKVKVKR